MPLQDSAGAGIACEDGNLKKRWLRWPKIPVLLFAMGLFTAVMLVLLVVGGIRHYSPVPFWDMWDGYLGFFLSLSDGVASAWWRQQNEHRIVLAHMLFWVDLRWFGGASWFLLAVNYLLAGGAAMLFWRMLRARLAPQNRDLPETVLGFFLVAWMMSWMQQENLVWAFQSQFFLAQLLPLCGLYCLYLATDPARALSRFGLACLCGLGAAGSMANGILALPMLAAYALLTRQFWTRSAILMVLAVGMLAAYFHGYVPVPGHTPFLTTLSTSPLPLLGYILRYLGSPFYFLAASSAAGQWLALLGGGAMLAGVLHHSWRWWRGRGDRLDLAVLCFLIYIVATATGTASGRLYMGVAQAFSGRYTTPALMAWAALLLLYAPKLMAVARNGRRRYWLLLPLVLLSVPLMGLQVTALRSQQELAFQKKIAALALELGIADQPQIGHVYPSARAVLPIAVQARERQLSVFGLEPWRGLHAAMGRAVTLPAAALPACQGSLDEVAPVEGDSRYLRVAGWLRDPGTATVPARVRFVATDGTLAGVALTGRVRPDVAQAVGAGARKAGFQGYVLASTAGHSLSMQADVNRSACALSVRIPVPLVSMTSMPPAPVGISGTGAVLPGPQWQGGNSAHTAINGMRQYGSFVQTDTDSGSISLRVKGGDRLFYRAGPGGGRQIMSLPGSGLADMRLPVTNNWAQLEFSGAALPDGDFKVTFTDAGDSWGEWLAIAVRE